MTAIRKHLVDFLAILGLIVVALAVASVILANQRLALPGWVPVLGQDFTEVEAELSSAQAVTPGQGQTVNVAGVEVGEISAVRLEDGKAIVTLKLEEDSVPVYNDASVLLRPKTGLKDMVAELTPGTRGGGRRSRRAQRIPIGQTLPDVNLDEILASLDGDTRTYLQLLLSDGGQALGGNGRALANTIRRFEPTARDTRKIAEQLATRRANIKRVIHNFSLARRRAGRQGRPARRVRRQLQRRVRGARRPGREPARDAAGAAVDADRDAERARQDRDAGRRARPDARGAAARARARSARRSSQTRPFLRADDADHPRTRSARSCAPRARRSRSCARRCATSSALTPDLLRTFKVVNTLVNTLAYNPPGDTRRGLPVLGLVGQPPRPGDLLQPGRARPDPPRPRRDRLPEPADPREHRARQPAARRADRSCSRRPTGSTSARSRRRPPGAGAPQGATG